MKLGIRLRDFHGWEKFERELWGKTKQGVDESRMVIWVGCGIQMIQECSSILDNEDIWT